VEELELAPRTFSETGKTTVGQTVRVEALDRTHSTVAAPWRHGRVSPLSSPLQGSRRVSISIYSTSTNLFI
jgi:hypothetical protein